MIYDTTNITNSSTVVEYFVAANQVSNGFLMAGLLAGLFVIFFLSLKGYETSDALVGSSFLVFVLSALLHFGVSDSLVGDGVFYLWLAVLVLAVMASLVDRFLSA